MAEQEGRSVIAVYPTPHDVIYKNEKPASARFLAPVEGYVRENNCMMKCTMPVVRHEVWYYCGMILVDRMEDAMEYCRRNDFDPEYMITPVMVSVAENGMYRIEKDS